jgi:hypothetical protein
MAGIPDGMISEKLPPQNGISKTNASNHGKSAARMAFASGRSSR